ncbi:unnamed protein product [Staurois parvus]|uniref:Phospholipid scramblase n=1 Tax=Staurois parvus TaxID=386267 RepID=A0ABN9FRB9_9NEOB|nr:unnamed protein product [Staurois parvus]
MAEPPAVPPELECLLQVSELRVKPTIESLRGFQRCCTYDLLGPAGNLMFQGIEQRELGGPRLELKVKNTQENNVLNLHVLSRIKSWDTKLQVSSSSGQLLGCIEKEWKSFSSRFDILDPSGDICLKVKGPGWGNPCLMPIIRCSPLTKKRTLAASCVNIEASKRTATPSVSRRTSMSPRRPC